MFKKTVLDNGVRVVSSARKDAQSLAMGIWINTGSRNETLEFCGISHYLEHLVFKGTRHYTCQQIKESIEGVGGAFNGFTSEETTCYLIKMPAQYLDLALDILSEMALCPSLPPEEIEKERTVILEEIKMYKDLPQSYVYDLLDDLLWPDQPLGRSILGTVESVSRIKRRDLEAYKGEYYTAPNIVLSAAGALNHARLCAKAKKIFSKLPKQSRQPFAPATVAQDRPQATVFHKETEQTHFVIGFHSLPRDHRLKYALGLLNVILGGNSSSRLFNEVREKRGLAYEIGSMVKRLKDTGAFMIHAGVDNAKVTETLRLVFAQVACLRDTLVPAGEFRRAREFFLGQLMLALEDTMDQMLWIGESTVTLDKTFSLSQIIDEVNKVTVKEIKEAARLVFTEKGLNVAAIGPLKGIEPDILKQLYVG